MNKIFKNMFVSAFTHKIQLFCLIMLTIMASSFFIGVNAAIKGIRRENDKMQVESGAHQFLIDLSGTSIITSYQPYDANLATIIKQDEVKLANNFFVKYPNLFSKIDLEFSVRDVRETYQGKNLFKVVPYIPFKPGLDDKNNNTVISVGNGVDVPIIVAGKAPTASNQIMLSPYFAKVNHISIGSNFDIQGITYVVTGFAVSYDMYFMQIDSVNVVPDGKDNAIVYCWQNAYTSANGGNFYANAKDRELYLVGRAVYKGSAVKTAVETNIGTAYPFMNFQSMFESALGLSNNVIVNSTGIKFQFTVYLGGLIYNYNDKSYGFFRRVNSFDKFVQVSQSLLAGFMLIIVIVASFIILIITKKRVDQDSTQIGIFKASGYHNWEICVSYLTFTFLASLIGGLLGTAVSLFVYYLVYDIFLAFFMLPVTGVQFSAASIIINAISTVLVIIGVTMVITYLLLYFNIRRNVIVLMNKEEQ